MGCSLTGAAAWPLRVVGPLDRLERRGALCGSVARGEPAAISEPGRGPSSASCEPCALVCVAAPERGRRGAIRPSGSSAGIVCGLVAAFGNLSASRSTPSPRGAWIWIAPPGDRPADEIMSRDEIFMLYLGLRLRRDPAEPRPTTGRRAGTTRGTGRSRNGRPGLSVPRKRVFLRLLRRDAAARG